VLFVQASADIFQLREDLRPAEENARIAHDEAEAATQSAAAKRYSSEMVSNRLLLLANKEDQDYSRLLLGVIA